MNTVPSFLPCLKIKIGQIPGGLGLVLSSQSRLAHRKVCAQALEISRASRNTLMMSWWEGADIVTRTQSEVPQTPRATGQQKVECR
jgi:hypothetical protein